MDRRAGRWVLPQNGAASGVDCGENGGDVLVDQSVVLPKFPRAGRCVEVLPQRSQWSLTIPTGVRDQQRLDL